MSGNRQSADAPSWTSPTGGTPLAQQAPIPADGRLAEHLNGSNAHVPWQDPALPVADRVADLLGRMTLDEKVAQLSAAWVGIDSNDAVAPHQHEFAEEAGEQDWARLVSNGLGQLTRPYGTAPIDPIAGARALARMQSEIVAANRFGIPAVAHEECLAGFTAWQATIYPVPLAWGASFDPELVERMAARIGDGMHRLGVHQGLAPVLDVTRDPRWGRTEETIGEDPYLVATVATAYVRGLQSAGLIATLKHFVGYSASRAGRNFGPVSVGPRELNDVLLPPFEMAVRDGGAASVMHAYADIDGMPPAADRELLTTLLRDTWGFTGTVVADYFGISFLETQHRVAGSHGDAAALALAAGLDVELPNARCYGEPLLTAVRTGRVSEELVDLAAARVLRQKCELGLLDPTWNPVPPVLAEAGTEAAAIDLDPPESRELARRLASESVVLLANDGGALPLPAAGHVALIGPLADDFTGMLGCYSFPMHVGRHHPELAVGVAIPTVAQGLRAELPDARIELVAGCTVDGPETDGFPAAVAAARAADVAVVVLGDRAGLFGNGTSGEGCDVADLTLPGVQGALLAEVLDAGTPVVLVMLSGRPYALGPYADRVAAAVQAFFPGEEGGPAVAAVLAGRVNPSGRLPVGVPRGAGGQPAGYLAPLLGLHSEVSTVDPTPLYPFGHGLSYTSFEWTEPAAAEEFPTDGSVTASVTVRNTGDRAGAEVVQLYLHDRVAQVARPENRLIGYARVALEPGQARRVSFAVHADLTSFTGRQGRRVVEPGDVELRFGASSSDIRHAVPVRLVGPERVVDHRRTLRSEVSIDD
jgi:beta-xylosidase